MRTWLPASRPGRPLATIVTVESIHGPDASLVWQLPGVCIANSRAVDGDQRDPDRRAAWLARQLARQQCLARSVVVPQQVHGTLVVDAEASKAERQRADGVVSGDPRFALGAYGADCPAVCLMADDALGIAHCGWRGTAGGIVPNLLNAFARCTRLPRSSWRAFIGPGISGTRYEVDAPVINARVWPVGSVRATTTGHAQLDLTLAITADLVAGDVSAISTASVCTFDDQRLWSYRRCGAGQVQLLALWRTAV